jgi:uncharacterized protein YndB with AHSA1/START domain
MTSPSERADRLVSRIVIRGRVEDIWRELTKQGEPQAAVFNAWLHAQKLAPGARLQMRTADGRYAIVIGEVLDFDPPRRFAHSFRFTQFDDAPCTVAYELRPVAEGVEVSLTVENLPVGTRTAKSMTSGATTILATLKAVVENGRPALGTRLMYWMMDRMTFVLPKRCRSEAWPM